MVDGVLTVTNDEAFETARQLARIEGILCGISSGADKVWEMGVRGEGVVIGGHDTGVQWRHPALKQRYRGFGPEIEHNYNWHDAIHSISALHEDSTVTDSTNPCGLNISEPCDDAASSHGTHTLGIALGYDPIAGITVGVAPEAKWIAVRNMERGYGSLASYLEGFEWFLAPTDLAGNNPDPAKAPDVINNSWACIEKEGCNPTNFSILQIAVENLRRAGIVVVVSAGNSGSSGCESINTPAAIYDASFTIGSTDQADTLSSFSSRGPVTIDGSFRAKPDVVAPGRGVLSSIRGDQYGNLSGTSMAGPHVAGVVALMISANPKLSGQVDLIEEIIRKTSVRKETEGHCVYPELEEDMGNYLYGSGRVDALAAVMEALNYTTSSRQTTKIRGWKIYPNPAQDLIHFENQTTSAVDLSIYDLAGKKIAAIEEIMTGANVNSSTWPQGTYIVEVTNNLGHVDHRLIQVIK